MRRLIVIFASTAAFAAFASGLQDPLAHPAGGEFQVNTTTTGTPARPIVGMDRDTGAFLVVWSAPDGSLGGTFGQCFAAGGTSVGSEFRVNASTTGYEYPGAVWALGAGAFVVIWEQDFLEGAGGSFYGRSYRSCGVPSGEEFRLDANTAATDWSPTRAGPYFVLAWEYWRSSAERSIYAREFSMTGAPASPAFRVDESPESYRSAPRVVPAGSGEFLVVWEAPDGDNVGIFARPLASCGEPVGHEMQVSVATTAIQDRFAAACRSGECLVVWGNRDHTYDDTSVAGRRVVGGAPIGSEFRVDSASSVYNDAPAVAANEDGFDVVWSASGIPWTVRARSYDAAGNAGPEIALSDSPANQFWPTAAAGSGGLVAAWGRNSDIPDGHGIFARRYAGTGDVDGNGVVDVRDVFWLINSLFWDGPGLVGSGDVNGDGSVDVVDVFTLIQQLFASPPRPVQGGGTPGEGPCQWLLAGQPRKP